MKKRRNFIAWSLVAILWVLTAVLLLFIMIQMRSYAGIINDSGVVRGGTQRAVKMELAEQPDHGTEERVTLLLDRLIRDEETRIHKSSSTLAFTDQLYEVNNQWLLLVTEMRAIESGKGSTAHLLELSEEHFVLADEMVSLAQWRAERDFLIMGIICIVLFLFALTALFFMRKDRIKKLKEAYYIDPLTKGRTMAAFEDKAHPLIASAPDKPYLLVYTNISNFRYINESYGYDKGDQLIITLSQLLEGACKRDELVAHTNADHFVMLLRSTPQRVEQLHTKVETELRTTPDLHFTSVLSFNCSVFEIDQRDTSIAHALSSAIAVMKNAPLGCAVAYYDETFRNTIKLKNRIEQHMEEALKNEEFELYLQPKNNLQDGRVVGAEALVRWKFPELGFLAPDSFIPIFEQNGFIVRLDFYMLENVCKSYPLMLPLHDEPLTISVNFSRATILHDGFAERILSIVDSAQIPHHLVEIELTESAFIVGEDAVIGKLNELKKQGFILSMDDFGTGYSSLNLLRKLPIDTLKIDRSFLAKDSDLQRSRAVLKSVVDMAKDSGLTTVCEGIETEQQAQTMLALGCSTGQGFFYSKPLPFEEFCTRYHISHNKPSPADKNP